MAFSNRIGFCKKNAVDWYLDRRNEAGSVEENPIWPSWPLYDYAIFGIIGISSFCYMIRKNNYEFWPIAPQKNIIEEVLMEEKPVVVW